MTHRDSLDLYAQLDAQLRGAGLTGLNNDDLEWLRDPNERDEMLAHLAAKIAGEAA